MNILDYVSAVPAENFKAGDWIFRQGDESNGFMYYVFSGTLKVLRTKPDGSDEFIADIFPGEIFGEIAILMNTPRRMSIKVESQSCKLGIVNIELFEKLCSIKPDFLFNILTSSLQKIERAESKLMDLEKEAKLKLEIRAKKKSMETTT